ncbi:MAG: VIT1/CCC1 family protein [Coriobacteriales bacterium]|jgi:VIT1/CCC1 family predicted Fe2+/Mn2+ transporter|nr:VIT1/CCC1 family protein [Coriobacteriales bacterium]
MTSALDTATRSTLLAFQKAEATDSVVYARMAKTEKHESHRHTLEQIALDEREHYEVWKRYTGVDVPANRFRATLFTVLMILLGYTFVLRLMERGEDRTAEAYGKLTEAIPEIKEIIAHEQEHEEKLIAMLDEERLQYVGAIVLGLNDALVELTGTIAGLTFALTNTRMVALAAIITGIAATLSMGASNYLAEKADHNPHPLKAALYTGVAYLITVTVLVFPYLILDEHLYLLAFAIMLVSCIFIIFAFNFYLSVAQRLPFWSRFGHMAAISLGVAAISFIIGLAAKALLGVDVA